LYGRSAKYYDKIYSFKDYKKESEKIHRYVVRYKKSHGRDLLDVACGTGSHIGFLKKWYNVEGLDNNQFMLSQARKKHPSVRFSNADMTRFKLNHQYDVITCLFSAIGHLKNQTRLVQAVRNMARHLKPGGLLILEPSFDPDKWNVGRIDANFVNEPKLKIARMNISGRKKNFGILNMHHLIASPNGIEHFVEHAEMNLFRAKEYVLALKRAGLEFVYDKDGLMGRGLYLGLKPVQ
jgi:ubiquinone/menaquinone biosynthesis C-methylase UbiE